MHPDVALGVVLRGLLDAVEAVDFGEDFGEQAGLVEEFEGVAGLTFGKHAGEFVADSLAADLRDLGRKLADGGGGFRVEGVAEARGEADGAEHAELVLGEAEDGVADGADEAGGEVFAAVDIVEEGGLEGFGGDGLLGGELERIENHAVDGEVAAEDVLFWAVREGDFRWVAAIEVGSVAAEGGNLGEDGLVVDGLADEDDAEVGSNREGLGEENEDDGGAGAGGDVVVLGGNAEEEVANASAGEVCLVAMVAEGAYDVERGLEGGGGRDGVGGRHADWLYSS